MPISTPISISLPIITQGYGSSLLIGEHSVLHGYPCVVSALNQTITVRLTTPATNSADTLIINSKLGYYQGLMEAIEVKPPLQFALKTIALFQHHWPLAIAPNQALCFDIHSDLNERQGFGSSAAVVVAIAKALFKLTQLDQADSAGRDQFFSFCLKVVRAIQKRASGADLAAAMHRGVSIYSQQEGIIDTLNLDFLKPQYRWSLIYSGYKTPTALVLDYVQQAERKNPAKYQQLYEQMGQQTQAFIEACQNHDVDKLLASINHYQSLMVRLGVSDPTLDFIVHQLSANQQAAAKISGSGLGDCVLALSEQLPQAINQFVHYPMDF